MARLVIQEASATAGEQRLTLRGPIDSTTFVDLETAIRGAMAHPLTELTVDFGEVDYISSVGVVVLLDAANRANESGMRLVFANVPEHVMSVLDLLSLVDRLQALCTVQPLAEEME